MSRKKRKTRAVFLRVEADLYDRLVRMIHHTGKGRTIQRIGESSLRRAVDDIEGWENDGQKFPPLPSSEEESHVLGAAKPAVARNPKGK